MIIKNASGNTHSVIIDLIKAYLFNNSSVKTYMQNGYIFEKSELNNDNFIVIDTKTGILRDINTINNFSGTYQQSQILITQGFLREDDPIGEIVNLGTFNFWWDGYGDILLTNTNNSISADDEFVIIGPNGTKTLYYGGIYSGPGVSIADICIVGSNNVQISVKDIYPSLIGCSELFIVLVAGADNLPFNDIKNLFDNVANNYKRVNWRRVAELTGLTLGIYAVGTGISADAATGGLATPAAIPLIYLGITDISICSTDLISNWNEPWFY